jgi:hypothetical protein
MKEAYFSDNSQLSSIRLIGFEREADANDLTMLANMVNDVNALKETHTFTGIDAEGRVTDHPVIEGTLIINTPIYREDEEVLKNAYGDALNIVANNGYYIKFEDDAVREICAANWGDKTGITTEQAAAVTSIGTVFKGNTEITSFDELKYFTSIVTLPDSAFYSCTSLNSINLANITSIGSNAFALCLSLTTIDLHESIKSIGAYAFCRTPINGDVYLPNLEFLGVGAFRQTNIVKVLSLGNITTLSGEWSPTNNDGSWIDQGVFRECVNLETVVLPNSLTEIGQGSFYGCTSLASLNIPRGTAAIGQRAFYNCTLIKLKDQEKIMATAIGEAAFNRSGFDSQNLHFPDFNGDIGSFTFAYCRCRSIVLGHPLTISGNWGNEWNPFYYNDNLEYVIFGDTLTTLGKNNFIGCPKLSSLIFLSTTPPALEEGINNSDCSIYVPDASVEAYKTATNWSGYAERIFPISQLPFDNPELYAEIKEYLVGYISKLVILPQSKVVYSPELKLTTYYDGIEVTPEYLTEETDVATVTEDGTITFLKEGPVTVIVNYNNESARETYKYIQVDFVVDKYFTPSSVTDVSYIENTNIKLFSDNCPVWTLKLSASNVAYASMGSDAALAVCNDESGKPWPGFYYGRYGNNNKIRLDINPNNSLIFNTEIPQTAIIRRNNNILEYSLDGSSYKTAISDLSSILAQKPRLAECPLIVGGYYDSNGNVGRPAYGHIKAELSYSVKDLEID